ncbi:UDP-N-acetylmuramoyl-tripeptide--D-alanyl-D-alanine ligase [Candidatus Aerophobetes bacterium]|nr:UDP-N-acetylmuramoyl-tripeptide--D-alanyl-D-alanine ligase [Candidatus Aerophobetes bacterium]
MVSNFPLQDVLEVTWGRLINLSENKKVSLSPSQICTDTRDIKKGDFFLALKGKNFDGNDFVLEAYKKGALGAIVSNPVLPLSNNFFLVQVNDTVRALQEIAKFYRHKLQIPLIGVTGSNGKTTVKELTARILSTHYRVFKSYGNVNNQIGVPLSILKITPCHQMAVLELGMNRSGEIKTLSRIVQPEIGIITNVHSSHLGYLGNIADIARAKAEIIPFLNRNKENYLILNKDDAWFDFFKKKATCKVLTFGIKSEAHLRASNIKDEGKQIKFDISSYDGEKVSVNLSFPGLCNVYNVLAASCAGVIFGLSLHRIKEAIESFLPPPLHYKVEQCGECNILNDCYNANPESMKSALWTLINLKGRKKIAILGDMLELGEYSTSLHRSLGDFAASLGIDALFTYGRFAADVASAARKKGLKDCFSFEDKETLVKVLLSYIKRGDCLLVKGSRETKMEDVISMLKNQLE